MEHPWCLIAFPTGQKSLLGAWSLGVRGRGGARARVFGRRGEEASSVLGAPSPCAAHHSTAASRRHRRRHIAFYEGAQLWPGGSEGPQLAAGCAACTGCGGRGGPPPYRAAPRRSGATARVGRLRGRIRPTLTGPICGLASCVFVDASSMPPRSSDGAHAHARASPGYPAREAGKARVFIGARTRTYGTLPLAVDPRSCSCSPQAR